jgi:hypothetical protein
MSGLVLQGLRRPTLVTQGYSAYAFGTGRRTVVRVALGAMVIDGRAGTQIQAAEARCRLALGRP